MNMLGSLGDTCGHHSCRLTTQSTSKHCAGSSMKPGCLPKKRASGGAWVDQNGFGMLPYYWILIDCRAADADTGRTRRQALGGLALLRQARRQCSLIVPTVCTLEGLLTQEHAFAGVPTGLSVTLVSSSSSSMSANASSSCSMRPCVFSDEHPNAALSARASRALNASRGCVGISVTTPSFAQNGPCYRSPYRSTTATGI
jgi:hypothetical protein